MIDLFPVQLPSTGRWKYTTSLGEPLYGINPPDGFEEAYAFDNGVARVKEERGYNLINEAGNYMCPEFFEFMAPFSGDYAGVGRPMSEERDAVWRAMPNMARRRHNPEPLGEFNLIDRNGKLLFDKWYADLSYRLDPSGRGCEQWSNDTWFSRGWIIAREEAGYFLLDKEERKMTETPCSHLWFEVRPSRSAFAGGWMLGDKEKECFFAENGTVFEFLKQWPDMGEEEFYLTAFVSKEGELLFHDPNHFHPLTIYEFSGKALLKEFEELVWKTYKRNKIGRAYFAAIEEAKALAQSIKPS